MSIKISELTAGVGIDGIADYFPIVQGGVTKRLNRNTFLGITGAPVGTTDSQILTNKTLGDTTFTGDLTITAADLILDAANLTGTGSNISLTSGSLTIASGNISLTSGNLAVTSGNITLDAASTLSAPAGGITVGGAVVPSISSTSTLTNKTLTSPVITSPAISGTPTITGWDGWQSISTAPTTVTALGNRSYTVLYPGVDLTSSLSPGMRMKFTRTVTAPTQCADLELGSSQYFSKTSPNKLAFTDDFTCMAWVKPESYAAGGIIARRNADTEGFSFSVNASGQFQISGLRIAANNVNVLSYQSLPLNKWVHIAASLDMSGTSGLLYVDGVLVPSAYNVTGTATALVQGTTALVVGAEKSAGTNPFDGKIAQAAVFSSVLSAATIRSYMSQGLAGNETNLCSAYSFNNSIADLNTTTPNDLTAQGSAVATANDTPFAGGTVGTTEYGIITKAAFSTDTTLTLQVPEGGALPTTGGITTSWNSPESCPFGFPRSRVKWRLESLLIAPALTSTATDNTWYQPAKFDLTVPLGDWMLGYHCGARAISTAGTFFTQSTTLSTTTNSQTDIDFTVLSGQDDPSGGTISMEALHAQERGRNLVTATTYTLLHRNDFQTTSGTTNGFRNGDIYAECAYL